MNLLELDFIFQFLNLSETVFLLFRHGHRDAFAENELGMTVTLNEEGQSKASLLGHHLKNFDITKIYTSPVLRCVQTAEKIQKSTNAPIVTSHLLGNPGCYVKSPKRCGSMFLEKGVEKITEMLIRSEKIPGFYSLNEGSEKLMNFLKNQKKGRYVLVTHDSILDPFVSWLVGSNEIFKFGFLEGILISLHKDHYHIICKYQQYEVIHALA
ncbi:MAG: hypothetical protein K940chlam8_00497 [Chlamydiae bacterium]|nr:hypothetical protein [Chlamydiota bacterium]